MFATFKKFFLEEVKQNQVEQRRGLDTVKTTVWVELRNQFKEVARNQHEAGLDAEERWF